VAAIGGWLALRAPSPDDEEISPPPVQVAGREPREPSGKVEEGDPAPTLALPDLEGRKRSLKEHRGRVVVMNFWASWCPPCIREMPSLQELHVSAGGDVDVIGVSVDDDPRDARELASRLELTFPTLLDPGGKESARWGTVMFPETWILDPEGHVVERVVGERDWSDPSVLEDLRALR